MSLYDVAREYSISSEDASNSLFQFYVNGAIKTSDGFKTQYPAMVNPLESFLVYRDDTRKCFTYNSILNEHSRNLKFKLSYLVIMIHENSNIIPDVLDEFYVSIHSPNSFPNVIGMINVDKEHRSFIN